MKHLSEEQLIDLVFEETKDSQSHRHSQSCGECRERLDRIALGLHAVRSLDLEPIPLRKPLTVRFLRSRRWRWVGWAAAASFLLLSLAGTRFELNQGQMSVEFAMFGTQQLNDDEFENRLKGVEADMLSAFQLHAEMMQMQVDDRLNALYAEHTQQMRELSRQVEDDIKSVDYQNGDMIASMRDDVYSYIQSEKVRGRTP